MSGLVRSYCKVDDCSVLYGNELDRIAEGACNITGVVLYYLQSPPPILLFALLLSLPAVRYILWCCTWGTIM
jgi:hypothetical protein